MGYNPNKPVEGSPLDAGEVRGNFNGLADMVNECACNPEIDPVQFEEGATTDEKIQALADTLNQLIAALKRN